MYEVVLTRLLSVVCWYYLAFVSISMAMFGMTAGALAVQLRPRLFTAELVPRRLSQATLAMAVSLPLALMTMLAVPLEISYAVQTLYSFLLFSVVIAVPFFFSGMAVCLSLTRMPFPMGRIYSADLAGAALGCIASVALLSLMDAPSAIFLVSALVFCSASLYSVYAGETRRVKVAGYCAAAMLIAACINASTLHGIQPIWSKGNLDRRNDIFAELWNPISRVIANSPQTGEPALWGPSPRTPRQKVEELWLAIDSDAGTPITRFHGDLAPFQFLRYDVTSLGGQMRAGGSAAIIGVGGGRDVLNCAFNGFHRIVGIEVNSAVADLASHRLDWFSGFSKIPGFELHVDEGRSFLTRSPERFDLIQASLVDTWAATSAGAMTLSENALYTVDGWRVFYSRLKPEGIVTFSRWYSGSEKDQTYRLFAVAKAMLLSEGVTDPERHLVLVGSGDIATLLAGRDSFGGSDLRKLRGICDEMGFKPVFWPGETPEAAELRAIVRARSLNELAALRGRGDNDDSPVFDSSPYFFNSVHLAQVPGLILRPIHGANKPAILFLVGFMSVAVLLVVSTIVLPAFLWTRKQDGAPTPQAGGIAYFIVIGLGFMLVEMAMMQQLSIFLGHPIYSLVVVLAGLILATGIGSLASDKLPLKSAWQCRVPAIAASATVGLYSLLVLPVAHTFTAAVLWERAAISLALVMPCGFLMGFCFPVGMRWMSTLRQEKNLPWMWALNGAAGTLGSFAAMVVSMDTSIHACVLAGAVCYLLAGFVMPMGRTHSPVTA